MCVKPKGKMSICMKFAGLFGIISSVLPLIMILTATFISGWFRWDTNALSDLGISKESTIFNSAVLIGGTIDFLFALGISQYLDKDRRIKIGVVSIMLSSICLALVGIFTENHLALHATFAIGYFILAPIGFILIGYGTRQGLTRKVSIVAGIAAIMAIFVLPIVFFVLSARVGFAVPELIEALIISAWTTFMSIKLLK
ncbi:MAG: DUF998 domain-containing protein [Nitrososphaeria archaeon]